VRNNERKFIHKISTSDYKKSILLKVNDIVKSSEMTLEHQAELVGLSKNGFYAYLKGNVQLTIDFLERFSKIHNKSIEYFLCTHDNSNYLPEDHNTVRLSENISDLDEIDALAENLKIVLKKMYIKSLSYIDKNKKTD